MKTPRKKRRALPRRPKKASKPASQAAGGEPVEEPAHVRVRDLSSEARAAYLENLVDNGGRQKAAARDAKIGYASVWELRKHDDQFAEAERQAMAQAMVTIEDEARRRAIEGCERVYYGKDGQVTRVEREYSDTILLRLLERMETGQWRQRQQVETGAPGAFKSAAELKAAIANRQQEYAKAKAEMEAERARDAGAKPPLKSEG